MIKPWSVSGLAGALLLIASIAPFAQQPAPPEPVQQPAPAPPGVDRPLPMPAILKQYQPVTADRLKNPADGDWPMIRRTYDGWGYSPLTQIETEQCGAAPAGVGLCHRRHQRP